MNIRQKIIFNAAILSVTMLVFVLSACFSSAQTARKIEISTYIVSNDDQEINNGSYSVNFAIYTQEDGDLPSGRKRKMSQSSAAP